MKNQDRYKTALERAKAFNNYCSQHMVCEDCKLKGIHKHHILGRPMCVCAWLDLETEEEKPLPCPFCGGECEIKTDNSDKPYWVYCTNCDYNAISGVTKSDAIVAHNRVAKAVMKARVG